MLYYLSMLSDLWSPLRVFRYVTVRAVAAAGAAVAISLLLGPVVIRTLARLKAGQIVRKEEAPPRRIAIQ